MTTIRFANVAGRERGASITLPSRRRRLSTVVRCVEVANRYVGVPYIVSVHRGAADDVAVVATDATVRLRKAWRRTLVGPRDVVLVTVLPLGGGRGGGGGGKGALGIGMAVASIALIALAPYAAPALAGAAVFGAGVGATTGTLATAIQAGMVIGGLALGMAANSSRSARDAQGRSQYTVAGGGNVPKSSGRRPILYGRSWSAPPLSQPDYFAYDGDVNVLTKRMTLGLGKYRIHSIRVGDALFWTEAGGIQAPFNSTTAGPLGTAVEFLYAQPSSLAPGDAITSASVSGQEMTRPGGNPEWSPWYPLTPAGVVADAAQMSWTYPAIYRETSAGRTAPTVAAVVFQGQEIDPVTRVEIGAPVQLWRSEEPNALTKQALRRSAYFRLPKRGAYLVRSQNAYPAPVGFVQENRATWDAMTALKDDARVRNNTTEIVLRVRAGAGLAITAFSDVMVEASRVLPVYDKAAGVWSEQATSKAVWAYADLVRADYGLGLPDGFDADRAGEYAARLDALDTFDGALSEVSSFWEAASTVLAPMRADPVKIGAVHSFVRDESVAAPRHVLTRRQIVADSSRETFNLASDAGDVIVEFDRDGDPKRPDEARYWYGQKSRTPKRYRVPGIRGGLHALKHATWIAAVGVFRGAERRITTEWDGRLVYPGDHILSDIWYIKGKDVAGVLSAAGNVLTLDVRSIELPAEWSYASIRTRRGREWGILRVRGAGAGRVELHAGDVSALAALTGRSLSLVLARETQDPTTIVFGPLVELQRTYVAKAAIPADADHVQIEMVNDDPRVWQLLDEAVAAPVPVGGDPFAEPLMPTISVLHARCERIETGIEVVWGVSITRGARAYEVELSYDQGSTWEMLSAYSPASTGRAQLRQADGPVTVRARAFGRTGLPGAYIAATFLTVAPIVDGGLVDITNLPLIPYEKLDPDAQGKIAAANAKADAAKAAADAASQEAASALVSAYGRLDELIRGLAVDPAVRAGHVNAVMGDVRKDISLLTELTFRLLADVATLRDNQAAAGIEILPDEGRVRIAAVARLEAETGERLTSLALTVNSLKGQIELYGSVQGKDVSGLVSDINAVRVRLDAVAATVSTLATSAQFDGVSARLGTAEQTITAQGAAIEQRATLATVDAQGVRLNSAETRISAAEGSIRNVVTAAGTSAVDLPLMVGTLAQMLDYLGEQTGGLYEHVARAETATSANFDEAGRAVAEVSTRLLAFQGDASAQFTSVTRAIARNGEALVQAQTLLQAQIGDVAAALTREELVRSTADAAQTIRTDGALSRLGTAEARIVTEEQTRASADGALAQRAANLEARTGANEAGITSLNRAVTDNQSATASQFQGVSARFGAVEANIQSLTAAYTMADSALTQRIDATVARVGGVEAGLVTEQRARADAVSAQADRTTRLEAQTNNDRGYFLASEQARINAEGALSTQVSGLGTRVGNNEGAVNQVSTALSSTVQSQAGTNIDLYARSDAGTAAGRIKFEAVSAPGGVAARFGIQLSTERGGLYRNSGLFMDILGDGSSRVVIDANIFALTANGGVTYPFFFDGQTLTVQNLRVTQQAILPGAVSDRLSLVAQDVDAGGFSNDWREVPGTGITLYPDADWALLFSGTAILQALAQGNGNLSTNTRLVVAVGLDGVPYGASFGVASATGGGGGPPVHTVDTPIVSGPALFEILPAGTPRRVALLYQLTGQIGSGRIKYGQLKAQVTKR